MRLLAGFLDLVFAPACAACDALLAEPLPFCAACAASIDPAPARPGGVFAPYLYGGELATALRRLKFDGRREVARAIAPLIGPALAGAAAGCDLLIPVPLHRRRLRERGYNQAALLLRHARRYAGLPVDPLSLRRARATLPQTGLDRAARQKNVDGAFLVVRPGRVAGRSILLCDDVVTTGATLAAASAALRAAGAARVAAFCVARAD
ncbi:MAG TPA: phosphoribosyltransferase family protein [Kofleriaceae bacterium]|nr:phosphoribosyltransferase family protein [Kofleriaceae bacterium]